MLTKRKLLSDPSFGSLSCHTGMASAIFEIGKSYLYLIQFNLYLGLLGDSCHKLRPKIELGG